jgi:hypothetical protein
MATMVGESTQSECQLRLEPIGVILAILCGIALVRDPLGTVKAVFGDKFLNKYIDTSDDNTQSPD